MTIDGTTLLNLAQIVFFISLALYLFGQWTRVTRVVAGISAIICGILLLIGLT